MWFRMQSGYESWGFRDNKRVSSEGFRDTYLLLGVPEGRDVDEAEAAPGSGVGVEGLESFMVSGVRFRV